MSKFFISPHPINSFELKFIDEYYVIKKLYEINKLGEFELDVLVTSPLRPDNNPGCKWVKNGKNKYRFLDFSSNNPNYKAIELWQFVSELYGLDYYHSMELIINLAYDEGFVLANAKNFKKKKSRGDKPTYIKYRKIPYTKEALKYWEQYRITKEDLIEDNVDQTDFVIIRKFSVDRYKLRHFMFKNINSFAIGGFPDNKCKIYVPEPKKFITNLKKELGNRKILLNPTSDNLYITTSYKDHRVIKNALKYFDLYGDVIWLQNEAVIPENDDLELISKYKNIYYMRDNDKAGQSSFENLYNVLNTFYNKQIQEAKPHNGRKDFAQLMKHDGYEEFKYYLK